MATLELPGGIKPVNAIADIDERYGPYVSIAAAEAAVPEGIRKRGAVVGIIESDVVIDYYWATDTVTNGKLTKKVTGTTHTHSYNNLTDKPNLAALYVFKGSVANFAALPSTDLQIGWVYNTVDTGANYAWDGTEWDSLGGLTNLATAAEDGLLSANDFTKLSGIEASAQVNKVEGVTVNGATLTPNVNKIINITLPDQIDVSGKENSTNKVNDFYEATTTEYPNAALVKSELDLKAPKVNPIFSGVITGNLAGNVTGNAATVTTNANLTGPITSVGNATTITDKAVTYGKIQDVGAKKLLGNDAATAGVVEELSISEVRTLLGVEPHPATHPPSIIAETIDDMFVSTTEKVDWNSKTPGSHVGTGGEAHANVIVGGAAGFMTGADKTKLDGIAANANNYTHPTTHPPSIIVETTDDMFVSAAEKAIWDAKASTAAATTTANGLMSAADKAKLNTVSANANPNLIEVVQVNGTPLTITSKTVNVLIPTPPVTTFTQNIPVILSGSKTLGKYGNGSTIPAIGKTMEQVMLDIAAEYINPAFTSFSITGQATTVEVGTTLSGNKTFTWGINQGSGTVGNINIYDNTAATNLLDGSPASAVIVNDGAEIVTITTKILSTSGAAQSWKGVGLNTNPVNTFNSTNFVVTALYNRFWGGVSSYPVSLIDGASNRTYFNALTKAFKTSGVNSFVLSTGTALSKFCVALPPGITITSVYDSTNNVTLTGQYILSTVQINDANGVSTSYNLYTYTISVPYPASANHTITTN